MESRRGPGGVTVDYKLLDKRVSTKPSLKGTSWKLEEKARQEQERQHTQQGSANERFQFSFPEMCRRGDLREFRPERGRDSERGTWVSGNTASRGKRVRKGENWM